MLQAPFMETANKSMTWKYKWVGILYLGHSLGFMNQEVCEGVWLNLKQIWESTTEFKQIELCYINF